MNLNDSGTGSLRQAILDAHSTGGQDTIAFASGVAGTINLLSTLPDLGGSIDLEGPGAGQLTVQRSTATGTPDFGIFNVPGGATVTVAGLTIANGRASSGGGISSVGNLTVNTSVVSGNTATGLDGGGIFSNAGSLTVTNSTISGNSAATAGAGIFNGATQADITNSTISGNLMAINGAGVYNNVGSTLTLVNSTIAGNHAANVGGGIANFGNTVTLTNATISGNTAVALGGGVFGSVTAGNTLIAGNTCAGSPDVNGVATSLGHNLIGDGSGSSGFTAAGDRVGTSANPIDPKLGPLQDNGGPTPTLALMAGSPAIDAGNNTNAPPFDQRGLERVVNGTIDIGSFEFGATRTDVTQESPLSPSTFGTPVTFTATVTPAINGVLPQGTVQFVDGSTILGSGTLTDASGIATATFTTTATQLIGGTHPITAVYVPATGNANYATSTSFLAVTYTVTPAGTTGGTSAATPPVTAGVRGIQDVSSMVRVTPVRPRPHKHQRVKVNPLVQTFRVTNVSGADIPGPVYLVLDRLSGGVVLRHAGGLSQTHVRPRDPFVVLTTGPLSAGQGVMATLTFAPASRKHVARAVKFGAFVLAGPGIV